MSARTHEHLRRSTHKNTKTQKHLRRRADVASSRSDLSLGSCAVVIFGGAVVVVAIAVVMVVGRIQLEAPSG